MKNILTSCLVEGWVCLNGYKFTTDVKNRKYVKKKKNCFDTLMSVTFHKQTSIWLVGFATFNTLICFFNGGWAVLGTLDWFVHSLKKNGVNF